MDEIRHTSMPWPEIKIVEVCDANLVSTTPDESFQMTKCTATATVRYRKGDQPWGKRCDQHTAWLAPDVEQEPIR